MSESKPRCAKLGSISVATHRLQDLIPRFHGELLDLDLQAAKAVVLEYPEFFDHDGGDVFTFDDVDRLADYARFLAKNEVGFSVSRRTVLLHESVDRMPDDDEVWGSSDAYDLLDDTLTDALDRHAPPLCHFGAHPGDGADFGFWFDREQLDEMVASASAFQVPDGSEWKVQARTAPEGADWWELWVKQLEGDCYRKVFNFKDPGYVYSVNDHGNLTVWDITDPEKPILELV